MGFGCSAGTDNGGGHALEEGGAMIELHPETAAIHSSHRPEAAINKLEPTLSQGPGLQHQPSIMHMALNLIHEQ